MPIYQRPNSFPFAPGDDMFDVIAVNIETRRIRILERNLTIRNADAYATMAVMRRGCEEEFFVTAEAGRYQDGDIR